MVSTISLVFLLTASFGISTLIASSSATALTLILDDKNTSRWRTMRIGNEYGSNSKFVKKTPDLKICNGDIAEWSDYPYMVALYNNQGSCFCSGSVLSTGSLIPPSNGVILTAAHCLSGSMRNGFVCVGCNKWTNPEDGDRYGIVDYSIHPEYDSYDFDYDVGIINLDARITTEGVQEVSICDSAANNNDLLVIQGYGETEAPQKDELMVGQTSFIGFQTCADIWNDAGYNNWILPSMTCMTNEGYNNAPQTDCYGDSGSPIMKRVQGNDANAIGLVSWGVEVNGNYCCPTDMPSVITDLCYPNIIGWLQPFMK